MGKHQADFKSFHAEQLVVEKSPNEAPGAAHNNDLAFAMAIVCHFSLAQKRGFLRSRQPLAA